MEQENASILDLALALLESRTLVTILAIVIILMKPW